MKEKEKIYSKLKYNYFDFHVRCPGKQMKYMNPMIKKYRDVVKEFGFYAYDIKTKEDLLL